MPQQKMRQLVLSMKRRLQAVIDADDLADGVLFFATMCPFAPHVPFYATTFPLTPRRALFRHNVPFSATTCPFSSRRALFRCEDWGWRLKATCLWRCISSFPATKGVRPHLALLIPISIHIIATKLFG